MRWLVILIIVAVAAVAVWLWRRSRQASIDPDRRVLDQRASTGARNRLEELRNRTDGSSTGGGGGGGWSP
ncbi:hypothetical protein [Micromonospora sp. WMMD714]|uniref:hypothetical protein n=1 Tax=Micromonospora sp. WMMD714 TaxID=3016097 RepID=UPI00249C70E2|nr:hypothetical protein [Micromonospora sp. WMMD714]WFE64754.1 hypothetical protein O7625_16410 [Micromonospora sp. WMMD714]